jgi:hypothetical protein
VLGCSAGVLEVDGGVRMVDQGWVVLPPGVRARTARRKGDPRLLPASGQQALVEGVRELEPGPPSGALQPPGCQPNDGAHSAMEWPGFSSQNLSGSGVRGGRRPSDCRGPGGYGAGQGNGGGCQESGKRAWGGRLNVTPKRDFLVDWHRAGRAAPTPGPSRVPVLLPHLADAPLVGGRPP